MKNCFKDWSQSKYSIKMYTSLQVYASMLTLWTDIRSDCSLIRVHAVCYRDFQNTTAKCERQWKCIINVVNTIAGDENPT